MNKIPNLVVIPAIVWCVSHLQEATGLMQVDVKTKCSEDADCPLWTECNNNTCLCREALTQNNIITCNKETLQLSVSVCRCVTFDPNTNELFEGKCMESCWNPAIVKDLLPLPINVSELNQFMCEEKWNRTGRLCGKCLPGHSPLAYSYDMRCVKCPEGNNNIWKYILIAFGPLTVFYFIVLFLKINVTSSYLHGCVIFCQVLLMPVEVRNSVQYDKLYPQTKISASTVISAYSIWNLDFFRLLNPGICLDLSPLTVMAFDYIVALYPLLLTIVSYLLIELHARNVRPVVILWKPFRYLFICFRRNLDSKTTVIDAYATFFVLSYTKILYISADLLTPVQVYSLNNDSVKLALYYDATFDYFGREHLPYAISAIFYSVIVIAFTLFIFVYQLSWFQRALSAMKLHSHIMIALMNSIQCGYKDGTEPGTRDYRWFAGVPLVGRALLIFISATVINECYISVAIVIIVSIIVLTTLLQPYKYNLLKFAKIDITFWGLLAIFYALTADTFLTSFKPVLFTEVVSVLAKIVLMIPLFYMFCTACYWILSRMRRVKVLISRFKAWRRGYLNIEDDFADSLPDRLINPEQYNQECFQDNVCRDEVTQDHNETRTY